VVAAFCVGLPRLKRAEPSVEVSTRRPTRCGADLCCAMCTGLDTLVCEDVLWIQAQFDGDVDKIVKLPGSNISANDVIIV
jgi:hypothetical protein